MVHKNVAFIIGEFCVALGAMDFVGGNYFGRHFPQFIVDRYSSFCDDNFV